jgi:hypothetical protein
MLYVFTQFLHLCTDLLLGCMEHLLHIAEKHLVQMITPHSCDKGKSEDSCSEDDKDKDDKDDKDDNPEGQLAWSSRGAFHDIYSIPY